MAAQADLSVKQRVQLYWEDLSYTVATPKGPKDLLSGVTGHASPGELLAVMGSSGAGKTTLLNVLSGRTLSGMLRGTLQLNGAGLVSRESFRKVAAFVTQDDVMMESQTPREVLHFSAALRLLRKTTASQRKELVDSLIGMLHLERAANTIIGHPSRGGISGGERKRVNVGTELVTNPSVVFLDEPTSGLDAFTSVKVMKILKDLAVGGRTVVATIHQPASEIFASFDTLCLMHTGSCGYFGPADAAVPYFDALGHTCPRNYNPADFLIGVLMRELYPDDTVQNGDGGSGGRPGSVDFISVWRASEASKRYLSPPKVEGCDKPVTFAQEGGASIPVQFLCAAKRNLVNYKREKLGVRARIGQTLIFGSLVGSIFWELELDEQAIQDRSGLLFFACLSQMLFGLLQVVLMFPIERLIFEREYSAGYYSIFSYFFAKLISETPFQIIFPSVFAVIITRMSGLQWDHVGRLIGVLVLLTNCAVALGFNIGALAPNPQLAVVFVPFFFIPFILVGGLLANKDRLEPYYVWLERMSFFSYGYESAMINELDGLEFTFNTTFYVAVPTFTLQPANCTVGPNVVMTQIPLLGEPNLENRSQEVIQDGYDILDRLGFDSTYEENVQSLGIWYACAVVVALLNLNLRVNGGRYKRYVKRCMLGT